MNKILFVIGPTATGKTKLGVELAKKFNGEIISADSRQVYRYMDIGTGKDLGEYGDIKYWGINLCDPDHDFNVAEFRRYAVAKISEIQNRNKLPIVVGGTGFYLKSILNPWETMDIKPNEELRKELNSLSVSEMQVELQGINKNKWDLMNESDRKNSRRLVRAIEVSGKNATSQVPRNDSDSLLIGLTASYEILYQRIDRRVEERINNGMVQEVQKLKKFKKLPKTLGYNGETPEGWKFGEHAYARRQMSYFLNLGKTVKINWFDITTSDYSFRIDKLVTNWYN